MESPKPGESPSSEIADVYIGPLSQADLAVAVVRYRTVDIVAPNIITKSIEQWDRDYLFGVGSWLVDTQGSKEQLLGFMTAMIHNRVQASVDVLWIDTAHVEDTLPLARLLFKKFSDLCPAWLRGIEMIVDETSVAGVKLCQACRMKATRVSKNHFGEHDGVVFYKPMLPEFGR